MNELNYEDMEKFIFNELVKKGYSPGVGMIELVLDLEMDYMIQEGFAEVIDDE